MNCAVRNVGRPGVAMSAISGGECRDCPGLGVEFKRADAEAYRVG